MKTERNAHVTGEIVEQAEISLPAFPLKMKNLASEREFYIPSVDLLTAQVKCFKKKKSGRDETNSVGFDIYVHRPSIRISSF